MASKARTKEQKNSTPFGCQVRKCEQHFKTVAQLMKHYKEEHPDAVLIKHDDGSFSVDLRKVKATKKGAKSKPKKDKPAKSEKTKSDEPTKPRGSKGGYDGFGKLEGIDLSKIILWKNVTDKKRATILEFARTHLDAKTSTVNGLKSLILNKYKVKVWGKQIGKALEVSA